MSQRQETTSQDYDALLDECLANAVAEGDIDRNSFSRPDRIFSRSPPRKRNLLSRTVANCEYTLLNSAGVPLPRSWHNPRQ